MLKTKLKGICKILSILLVVSLFCTLFVGKNNVQAAVQATYYVATTGSDTNPGTVSLPFATIQKARDVVRTINSNMTGDIIVYIRGGKYFLDGEISFNEIDSGTNGYKVYYKNYPEEEPIIYGGKNITNWTLDSGNVYKSYVGTNWKFNTLFENDKFSTRARTPNAGYFTTESKAIDANDPFVSKEAEGYSNMSGVVKVATGANGSPVVLDSCDSGDWVCYDSIDFDVGAIMFEAIIAVAPQYAGQNIEIRLDSPMGTLVGTLTTTSTDGADIYKTQSCSISGASGVHGVYLVFSGTTNVCKMDWFQFIPVIGNVYAPLEAENYSGMNGIQNENGGTGTVVGSIDNGDWIKYSGIDFGDSRSVNLYMQIAVDPQFEGQEIEIRLDSLTGSMIGAIDLRSTLDATNYKTQVVGAINITGIHDVYLVFKGTVSFCRIDWIKTKVSNERIKYTYKASDIPVTFDYSNAIVFTWPGQFYYNWFSHSAEIRSIDINNRVLTLNQSPPWKIDTGTRYFLQGSRDFLDYAGEYYLDESTGWLYYWPQNTPIENQEIIVPTTKVIFDIKGSSVSNLVSNIQFEGLTLKCTDTAKYFSMSPDTVDPSVDEYGTINAENAVYITIKYCKILNSGYSAINMPRYAQHNTVYGNWIEYSGYNGVNMIGYALGSGNFLSPAEADVNKYNTISNNLIRNCGVLVGHGSGIQLTQSGENEISYNKISRMSRYGISLKGSRFRSMLYSYYGTVVTYDNHWDFLHSRNNIIKFNDISDCSQDTQDGGAIESWGTGKGNVIDNNRIYNSITGIIANNKAILTMGIYLDDCSDYFTVKNNIIYGIDGPSTPFPVYMKGVYNTFTNNIIADNGSISRDMAFWAMDLDRNDHITLTKNIFYSRSGSSIYQFMDWTEDKISESDNNVFYHPGGSYLVYGIPGDPTYDNWKTLLNNKYDQNSVVADPLFEDEVNHNYTVKSGSPALARGFININQEDIGLKSDFPWNAVSETVSAFSQIEAEYSDTFNIGTNRIFDGVKSFVGNCDAGDWVRYYNVDFGAGVNEFTANVAVDPSNAGKVIEIRLDTHKGKLLGALTLGSTGSINTYIMQSCNIENVKGIHNVVLYFKDGNDVGHLDWFKFNSHDLVYSDFESGNADGWSIEEGSSSNWSVVDSNDSKRYKCSNLASVSEISVVGSEGWSNYIYTADIDTESDSGYPSIIFRYKNLNQFYMLQLRMSDNVLRLYKRDTTYIQVGSDIPFTLNANTIYRIKIEAINNLIRVYLNDVLKTAITDSSYNTGKIGFRSYAGISYFDNVRVEDLRTNNLYDDFEDGDSNDWTIIEGLSANWSVTEKDLSKRYMSNDATATSQISVTGDTSWSNYTYTSDIITGTDSGYPSLIFRYQDSTHYYMLMLIYGENKLRLYKRDGSYVQIGADVENIFSANTLYKIKVDVNGSSIKVYVNDALKMDMSDSSYSTGKIGVRSYGAPAYFDNNIVKPVTIFRDDFEDGNALNWSIVEGSGANWSISEKDSSARYKCSDTTNTSQISVAGDTGWSDYTYSADIKTESDSGYPSLIFRYQDSTHYYMLQLLYAGNKLRFYKWNGSYVQIGAEVACTMNANSIYAVKIVTNGTSIKIFVNDALKIDTNDSSYSTGKVGVRSYASVSYYDNVNCLLN